jgi:hypothetical protein
MMALPLMLKAALKKIVPKALYPSAILRRSVQRRTNTTVIAGPFRGMQYLGYSIYGAYIPKLIGSYEAELHQALEAAIARKPKHIIDIGGAEGYYAVGLLTRLPDTRVTVFERLEEARTAIAELAELNGVAQRLDIRGDCDPTSLSACLEATGASLIITDVEGYETRLLDPVRVPLLARTDLIVEVHDFVVPDCSRVICETFERTHRVTVLHQRPRIHSDYPFKDAMATLFPGAIVKYGLNEFRRPDNWWVWLEQHELSNG